MAPSIKIDDRVWRKLRRRLAKAGQDHVKIGVLASKGGSERRESGITMVELAAIHEFGSPAANIDERSFIRRTFDQKRRQIGQAAAVLVRQIVEKGLAVDTALNQLGAFTAAEVKKTIASGPHIPPPLEAATIARKTIRGKKGDRPLVDTSRLVGSIQWEVGRKQ